jgi:diguanylate cyclase (GGDEF)-like protein
MPPGMPLTSRRAAEKGAQVIRNFRILCFLRDTNTALDLLLRWLSLYAVPLAIGAFSLVALTFLESPYTNVGGKDIDFRVVQESGEALEPAQALAQLRQRSEAVSFQDTHLAESPFWFSFAVPPMGAGEATELELPSRHATDVACWNATDLSYLGGASRLSAEGALRPVKAGFALDLGRPKAQLGILCRGSFVGPARITVVAWQDSQLDRSIQTFHRESGLLEGGLIVLSLLVLLAALLNREWMYVLFAAWLVASLRAAALSVGWDILWLGHTLPPDWMPIIRKLTIAAYYTLTYSLFNALFREDLKRVGYSTLLRLASWSCVPLWILAAFLPYAQFLPIMWMLTIGGIAILIFLLVRIMVVTRSRVAMWYATSIGIALFAGFYEVISAALGVKGLIGVINSVTAALVSCLMAAMAIAEQIRQEHLLRLQAQAELKETYQAIPIGLFTLDAKGGFLQANPALYEMLGRNPGGEQLKHWSDHFGPDAWTTLQGTVRLGADCELEIQGHAQSGDGAKRFLAKVTLSQDKIEGSLQDITERAAATERLRFLAEYDPLTSVLNRRGIEQILGKGIARIGNGEALALAYLDLDRFKLINDLFGHQTGDEVLRQVCQRIKETLSAGHEIGRVGGDEFVIVFQRTAIAEANEACRMIVDRIATQPYRVADKAFQVKGSIGLIEISGGTLVKDAISVADLACREAKKGHHNNLVVYARDAAVFRERDDELRLIERFGVNTVPDGLFLEMQPIMSLRDPYGSHNFEVLLRLREADQSVTGAAKIITAAENNGRISAIDRWVLATTLEWLDSHHDKLKNTRFVCVNLSGASLNDEKFIQDAFAMVAQYGRVAELLCFEITESVALHDLDNTRRFIDRVRGFGAKVALDDFGAGYTSFSYLKELPADAIKIDGSFVRDVNARPADLAIIGMIAELAHNLGMKSIAEWAEDCATVAALAEVGVDYVQGYAISRPTSPLKILGAESSAGMIERDDVALYVRNVLVKPPSTAGLWDPPEDLAAVLRH